MHTLISSPSLEPRTLPGCPPRRIVVATADDDGSAGAIEVASSLSAHSNSAVLAVAAVEPSSHVPRLAPSSETPFDDESRCAIPEAMQRALRDVPHSDRWTKRAFRGWPADVVNDAAASWDASLIIVGLGGHRTVDRLFGTETAINVIKHAKVPVLAVPDQTRGLPRHACAAIDFTEASVASALLAASLLADDGTLTLVHACTFAGLEVETDAVAQLYRQTAGNALAEVLAVVRRNTKRRVNGLMLDGEPTQTIVEFVRNERCDLVSLGGHAQGLVDRILIGSIRTRVLRAVDCSVLVAPPHRVGG
jgi:nucleotide-binding universal stress UspA family protein